MEQVFNILSNLEVRFIEGIQSTTIDCLPTARFQFVVKNSDKILVQSHVNYQFKFEVFYQHQRQFYSHPYTLRQEINRFINNTSILDPYQQITYDILLYLDLKRLQDFDNDDLKRYYEVIDKTIDSVEEIHDFHDIYLVLHYEINGQLARYQCNNGQPIHLPKFISHPWTYQNTLTRFRYDAENRDGTFPCEMTLRYGSIPNLQSYKIVLCFISNTIPPRMDYHAIRWFCKLKPKMSRQNESRIRHAEKEKSYNLHHSLGIIIAQVNGPDLKFSAQLLNCDNNGNYVQSYFEPDDFQMALKNAENRDNSTLAVAVVKGTDYPLQMRDRRTDQTIRKYLPFDELADVNKTLELNNGEIVKRLKRYKDECNHQLILNNENDSGTYSQTHVRLYVAAYDNNNTLLTESLHPPIRNNKSFEQLRITRIVQPKKELHANEPAYVYCDYDYNRSLLEDTKCPYEFELVFTKSINNLNENQLERLFKNPHIRVQASTVPNCACLLQFQVPNDRNYHEQRVYIRLRHRQSKDYNPSPIALCDKECWIYHADPISVMDIILIRDIHEINNSVQMNSTIPNDDISLEIRPVLHEDLSPDCDDTNQSPRNLTTPDIIKPRFTFPNSSSEYNINE